MDDDHATALDNAGYIDAFVIGISGQLYGKREPAKNRKRLIRDGLSMSACSLLFDARGVNPTPEGIGGVDGDPDAYARVVGELVPVAWAEQPTQQCLMELIDETTQEPFWYDPRTILRNVVKRLNADGLFPVIAFELEFYLIAAGRTTDGGIAPANIKRTGHQPRKESNLDLAAVEDYADFIDAVMRAARAQGLAVSTIVSEYGIGQFEINLDHGSDPVFAADHAALLRRLITGVARAQGHDATFMAKPFIRQPGSGMHVHVNLTDENGINLMAGDTGILHSSVAGLQIALPESLSLFAPNFPSYRRLQPKMFVPMDDSWGHNNRSVAFRIPMGPDTSRRIEHRVAGADACPHLVLAAILAGMHAGIKNHLTPTPEAVGAAREARTCLPRNLCSALEATARGNILRDYLTKRFLELYRENRLGEFETLTAAPNSAEYDMYL